MSPRPPVVRAIGPGGRRSHRLVPGWARRLRSREIVLSRGGAMAWHSTGRREELLICLTGRAVLEWQPGAASAPASRLRLQAGQAAFLGAGTRHHVLNAGTGPLRYLYVTG